MVGYNSGFHNFRYQHNCFHDCISQSCSLYSEQKWPKNPKLLIPVIQLEVKGTVFQFTYYYGQFALATHGGVSDLACSVVINKAQNGSSEGLHLHGDLGPCNSYRMF